MNLPKQQLRIVDRNNTLALLDFPSLITSAERAFVAHTQGNASPPQYINMPVGKQHFAHFKAGHIEKDPHFAVKYSGGFWGNTAKGLPVDYGFVMVFDAQTGKPEVMFLDQGAITDYRTAAAGAVAAKYLSRENSTVASVIGTGTQARLQIEALLHVRPSITRVQIWGRSSKHVDAYLKEMHEKFPSLTITAHDTPSQAMQEADILVTVTASHEPIVRPEWITPGMHITAVGACTPSMQEHDPLVLAKATRIFADSIEKCIADGELHHAIESKTITRERITGELGAVITGSVQGRVHDDDITFVDLVGLGVQDAAAAETLMSKL